ncbi:hypothetical protein LY90DRAFT_102013 [Neocallimastix californiae]|uniref:Uncharacterized protein n=1 Tax=Neocallimastix californiae TaxID=1754190 RepID=A0A1Y2EZS6_9FUNG|nr:hypothetical protein LY90DRAFT_102013 [Neocallimastix californiae]|eukprot:ORY77141.1 hypothetical protein LY90DRAFT_102013 [Neocallimastix californiae]
MICWFYFFLIYLYYSYFYHYFYFHYSFYYYYCFYYYYFYYHYYYQNYNPIHCFLLYFSLKKVDHLSRTYSYYHDYDY